MSFLTPWAAAVVGAVAVPALLLLYFLKLRRRREVVSSTLLWRRAVQDLRVNAPFQRLRRNLLLLLQLLVLAGGILALARPVVESDVARARSVILLIDRSASMNAVEGARTRLDLAKEQAVRLVRALNRSGSAWFRFRGVEDRTRVMVIAFDDRAAIVSPFTTETAGLPPLIEAIAPTDGGTRLREALDLAQAYAAAAGEAGGAAEEPPPRLVLISDGAIADASELALRHGRMELLRVGATRDNVAVTAMRTQRGYERPELLSAFVQVRNFAPEPVTTDLALYVGEAPERMTLAAVQTVALAGARSRTDPASAAAARSDEDASGMGSSASVSFELELERGALLEARLSRRDALAADNSAFAVVPPPKRMRVLLVSEGNAFLEYALRGLPLAGWERWTPAEYESRPIGDLLADGRPIFDVVILDKHETERVPSGGYLCLGCVPRAAGMRRTGELAAHAAMWWDDGHALLRHAAFEQVLALRGITVELPPEAHVLAEGPAGPMMARHVDGARHFVIVTFAVEDSTWWQKPGFPIFAYNAIRWLGAGGAGPAPESTRPGEPVRIVLAPHARRVAVSRPDGGTDRVDADLTGAARYAGARRVGVYRVGGSAEGRDMFVVDMQNAAESDLSPRDDLAIGQTAVATGRPMRTSAPEAWRWFVGAALAILLLEWYIYTRRVRL